MIKVLVACEFSGVVRDAFNSVRGCKAVSCDIEPTESLGPHFHCDINYIIGKRWDLMIAHPPCTHLATSGAKWFSQKQQEQEEALSFVELLLNAPVPRICLENPVGVISTRIKKPTQIVEPYMFGHPHTKATCLWLKGLPRLKSTNIVRGKLTNPLYNNVTPGKYRGKHRSVTYKGIAKAMAEQWTQYIMKSDLN